MLLLLCGGGGKGVAVAGEAVEHVEDGDPLVAAATATSCGGTGTGWLCDHWRQQLLSSSSTAGHNGGREGGDV